MMCFKVMDKRSRKFLFSVLSCSQKGAWEDLEKLFKRGYMGKSCEDISIEKTNDLISVKNINKLINKLTW